LDPVVTRGLDPVVTRGFGPVVTRGLDPVVTRGLDPVVTRGLDPVVTRGLGPVLAREFGPVAARVSSATGADPAPCRRRLGGTGVLSGVAPGPGISWRRPGGALQIPVERPSSTARQVCVEVTSAAGSLTARTE
jgi:hypothetical protein